MRLTRRFALLVGVVLTLCASAPFPLGARSRVPPGSTLVTRSDAPDAAAIEALVLSSSSRPRRPGLPPPRAELGALYGPGGYAPLWLTREVPTRDARAAVAMLLDAGADGLSPADYGAPGLDAQASRLEMAATSNAGADTDAQFDVALSAAVLTFLHDLHEGRLDPRRLGLRLSNASEQHDFVGLLRASLAEHRIEVLAEQLRPPLAQYRLLRETLARHRVLQRAPQPALSERAESVRPGDEYADAPRLEQWLHALGDVPAGAGINAAPPRYEAPLVEGVRRFQARHGLASDGVIGKGTRAALRVPMAHRVRQLELALERLRWLPDVGAERLVALNIPMFRLWAWDDIPPDGMPLFGMDAIVGRALRTQTPVFVEEMREVIIRPYWNVPASIARGELLPMIRRNPDYLRAHAFEIVRGGSDESPVVSPSEEAFDEIRRGGLRLRQRPGPDNALGLIKFDFPNAEGVYMHGTPAQELFARARRDFSHGCVRLEDPVALAEWALKENPGWDRARIEVAAQGTRTVRVTLARPIQVVLFYTTAAVMPEDGTVWFADDIYRHDSRLEAALAAAGRPE